jgi:hypothetical protein
MISFSSYGKARSRHRISPGFTGYSSVALSMPRTAAAMMWSRSCSPPRFRFIGLKRSSIVVTLFFRYAPPTTSYTARSTASGELWMSSVQWKSWRYPSNDRLRRGDTVIMSRNSQ